ncbi:MAG: TVP38/TMEM64 family protein, partial [Polyangiaceae bacterium]|nr:TVP38/TMEM64 family protein [Polyangiaceae bacterium]
MVALLGLVGLSIAACVLAIAAGWVDMETLKRLVADRSPASMATYVVTVFVLEMLWFPRAWGLLVGGLAFGPLLGAALSIIADMATAVTCYVVARGSGRAWVAHKMQRTPRLRNVVEVLARERGTVTVFLLRVMPVHYTAVGYAAGLSGVAPRPYLLGCLLGVLPTALLYTFVGDAAREPGSPIFIAGVAVVVVLGLGGILYVRRLWKSQARPTPTPLDAGPAAEPAAVE